MSGGTVSLIRFTRNGTNIYNTGQTSGMFAPNAADRLIVTYSAPPTITFVPYAAKDWDGYAGQVRSAFAGFGFKVTNANLATSSSATMRS